MPPVVSNADAAEKCPVDHNTRQQWLDAASKAKERRTTPAIPPNTLQLLHRNGLTRFSLDKGNWEPVFTDFTIEIAPRQPQSASLPNDREISSIPRAIPTTPTTLNSAERAALPANSEADTGHDSASGNWIYPSQQMFFAAMKRKGHAPNASDMSSIVPIHNAVNERAWAEIKAWEGDRSVACGGPKLVSFAGDSKKLTPRARWNSSVMGYQPPFDRHDWVVERCGGERVEYVIDFYKGKDEGPGMGLGFYLDVRPKLNSFEGVWMRVTRAFGA